MAVQDRNRLPIDSQSLFEVGFVLILIWMLAGPISGTVLSVHSWISTLVTKSANQLESTKYIAQKLLVASAKINLLEKKVADDQLEITKLKEQARDTNRLRALLGLKAVLDRTTIAADVITRNPDNWFKQVTIDKGTLDNITVGSAVLTSEGAVGQVVSVSNNASVVRLLTDPDQKLGVLIARIGQPGVLTGQGNEQASIDFIPVGTNVDVGDKVVSLGNGGIFPAGHPVGVVTAVHRNTNGTTLSIEVRLAENLLDLRQVLVVPPQGADK